MLKFYKYDIEFKTYDTKNAQNIERQKPSPPKQQVENADLD